MGITNKSIEKALIDLIDKNIQETTIAFVPTASNLVIGDKRWIINGLVKLKELGFKK